MEVELKAGAKLNFVNKDELRSELAGTFGWMAEAARVVKFRDISATGVVDGTGAFVLASTSPSTEGELGPAAGFVWAVTRLAVSGTGYDPTAKTFSVFKDEAASTRLVISGVARSKEWNIGGLVVPGGSELVITGTGTASGEVAVSGAVVEVPVQYAWRLIG